MLATLQRGGLTILLTTPYLDEAERCHRVALMDHGRLLVTDTPDELRRTHPGCMVEVLATPKGRAREVLAAEAGVTDLEVFGERLHASLPAQPRAEAQAAAERLALRLRESGIWPCETG